MKNHLNYILSTFQIVFVQEKIFRYSINVPKPFFLFEILRLDSSRFITVGEYVVLRSLYIITNFINFTQKDTSPIRCEISNFILYI